MRDHYVGDVTDFLKFSLLKTLVGSDRRLGIAWYYIPGSDNDRDGRHLEWLDSPSFERVNPSLHKWLANIANGDRRVAALEDPRFWPNAIFHRDEVAYKKLRHDWASVKRSRLDSANLVFLDPDNGIADNSRKHVSLKEIAALRKDGRTLICISFPHFSAKHDVQLQTLQERIHTETSAHKIITIRTNISVPSTNRAGMFVQRQRWFTVLDFDDEIEARIEKFKLNFETVLRLKITVHRWEQSL